MSQTHSIQNHMSFLHVKFIHLWIYQNMGLTAALRERGFVIIPPHIYPGGFDEVEWDFNKSPRVLLIDFKQFMSWVCCLKVMRNILVKAQKYYTFIVVKTHSSRFFSSPFRMVVSHCDTTLFWPFSFVDFLWMSFLIVSELIDPLIWAWSSWY